MSRLIVIPLSSIRENPVALRAVNRESEQYLGLVESIRTKGFFGAITVREKIDAETGESFFELVDGLHRFSAAKDASLSEINADVVDLTDDETLEAQVMANIHKIETRPVEYSQQLRRILTRNPLMTEAQLAATLGKSTQWIKERLGLNKIVNEEIQSLIDEGKIGLANAYALAKLPPEEQVQWVDRAMTSPPDEFIPAANSRCKEIREAKRKGENASDAKFQPVAFMQKMKEVKAENETPTIGPTICATNNASTPEQGFALGIAWCLHLDPDSATEQEHKDEERKVERAEAKQKRDAERTQKKSTKAQKDAAEAAQAAEKAQKVLSS
ncbi:MAG: ParB/RepB/Spo0J family partition protein [Nitrosopumilus sp.]